MFYSDATTCAPQRLSPLQYPWHELQPVVPGEHGCVRVGCHLGGNLRGFRHVRRVAHHHVRGRESLGGNARRRWQLRGIVDSQIRLNESGFGLRNKTGIPLGQAQRSIREFDAC